MTRKKSPKKYWFNINNLRGRPARGIQITSTGDTKGHRLTDPKDIEGNMRAHWKTHFVPLSSEYMHPDSVKEIEDMFKNDPDLFEEFLNADFSRLDPHCPYTNRGGSVLRRLKS